MTKPLRKTIEIISECLPKKTRVLEIGSRQEKNQRRMANLRDFFQANEYIGVDMRPGPGVDRVINGEKLPFKKESFDVVLCLETFEHAEKPWEIAEEIERVVKKSGVIIVSSQQNFPIHMHPSDYFRFTPYGLASLFKKLKTRLLIGISAGFGNETKLNPETVILVGWQKKTKLNKKIKKELKKRQTEISGHKPYRHRLADGWKWMKRGLWEVNYEKKLEFF